MYFVLMAKSPLKIILGLMMLLAVKGLQADPLNQWTWRFPYPQGYTLAAVTYGGGLFVAVGDNGTIIASPDGYNWTIQNHGVFPCLRGVAYADGEYVAVGDGGVILVSSNAATWTQISSVTSNSLHSVAGDSSWQSDGLPQFLAVGDSGTAVVCSNGTNWSAISSDTSNALYAVTFTTNLGFSPSDFYLYPNFIAVGDAGTVTFYSTSGFSQCPQDSVGVINNLYGVASDNNGVVAAVGDLNSYDYYNSNGILYSLYFGYYWDLYGLPNVWNPSSWFILHGVAFGTNGFVAVGDTGYTLEFMYPGVVCTSINGSSWSELPALTSENRLYGCTYGNGLYVLVGDAGAIVVSSNLVTWTEVTGYHRSAITAIAYNGNLCIASALPMCRAYSSFADFTTLVSTNGVSWSVSTTNLPAMVDLTSGRSEIVGVSGNGIYTTTDGYNWQTNSSFTSSLHGVDYANGRFIAVGDNGGIFTSVDSTNWNDESVKTSGSFYSVAYGNGIYVAAGSVAATSSDGLSWSLCASNPPADINRIVHAHGQFVAAASVGPVYARTGELLSSQDGINWQIQFTAPSGTLISGLAYNGGTFLAISACYAKSGAIFKSLDGTNWFFSGSYLPAVDGGAFEIYYDFYNFFPFLGGSACQYSTVCSYKGTFLAAGLDGIMVQSDNTWNPVLINMPQATSNGFVLSYNQQIDVPYHIQASTNLLNWENVYSGIGSGQPTNFTCPVSGNFPGRFFRIVSP